MRIKIESIDEECDCLKFFLESGNVYELREILAELDEKILNDGE